MRPPIDDVHFPWFIQASSVVCGYVKTFYETHPSSGNLSEAPVRYNVILTNDAIALPPGPKPLTGVSRHESSRFEMLHVLRTVRWRGAHSFNKVRFSDDTV